MFLALWEHEVKPGNEGRFERLHGTEGEWTRLFRQSRAYRGTRLLRDAGRPWIYVTMDCWDSREEYEQFLKDFGKEYDAIDRAGEELTAQETCVGHFEGTVAELK